MEDVSFGEFIAWLWDSNAIIWAVLAAVAIKVIRDNIKSDRSVRRKMREMGLIDERGRRIPRAAPQPYEPTHRHWIRADPPPIEKLRAGDTWQVDSSAPTRAWSGSDWTP